MKNTLKLIILILTFICLGRSALTVDTFSIQGTISDNITHEALAGVTVHLQGTNLVIISNHEGKFIFANLTAGDYEIDCSKIGYKKIIREIHLVQGNIYDLAIFLRSETIWEDDVIVTATRCEATRFDIPQSISIINNKEFHERPFATTADMLREEPGVMVQKTTAAHGSPIIRGLVGNYIVLLYNGIRLNKSTFRFGPNQYLNTIDANGIAKIEVLRGSSSVMYGSDAIGGVINIFPHQPVF